MKYIGLLLGTVCACSLMCGCGSADTTATKSEEEAFRNPPKEPPAGAMEGMKKGMESVPK
jgi:hypothetical protein